MEMEKWSLLSPPRGHRCFKNNKEAARNRLTGKSLVRAVVVSFAVMGGVSFWGAGTAHALVGDGSNASHDESTKTTTVTTGNTNLVNGTVYGNSADETGIALPSVATAEGYTVNMDGGNVNRLYGGYAESTDGNATASSNIVNFSGGSVRQISAGYAFTNEGKALASGNTLNISGGILRGPFVAGGEAASWSTAEASSNTINISATTLKTTYSGGQQEPESEDPDGTEIVGGLANDLASSGISLVAKNNVINLLTSGMTCDGNITLMGYKFYGTGTHSGNTLNVFGKNITVYGVKNFENMNFFLPADTASGDTMLTVTGTANLTGTTLGAAPQAGLDLNVGDTVNLLTAGTLTTDDTLATLNTEQTLAKATVPASISTDNNYTFNITKSANSIIATVTSKSSSSDSGGSDSGNSGSGSSGSGGSGSGSSASGGNGSSGSSSGSTTANTLPERTKSLAETMAGSVSLLNGGVDMTVGQSFDNAAAAVEAEKAESGGGQQGAAAASGFAPFATIGGSNMRAKSGSYVATKGWGIDVGFAREVKNKQGKLLFGPMVGYGRGNYDSYLDSGVHGSGKTSFWSLGLMAKQMNNDGLYYEGSIRGGKVKSDYYSGNFNNGKTDMNASYDTSSSFFAAHLGIGKVFDLSHANKLDTYLKYYYTHQGGDRVTISSNVGNPETFDFDSVNSSRLRVGLRFTHALNQRQEVYTGLAYQYEFDGDARATYNGNSTPSPSIKGSSGMLELGFRTKVSSNMDLDLSVNDWVGKQRGVNAQLGMQWKF